MTPGLGGVWDSFVLCKSRVPSGSVTNTVSLNPLFFLICWAVLKTVNAQLLLLSGTSGISSQTTVRIFILNELRANLSLLVPNTSVVLRLLRELFFPWYSSLKHVQQRLYLLWFLSGCGSHDLYFSHVWQIPHSSHHPITFFTTSLSSSFLTVGSWNFTQPSLCRALFSAPCTMVITLTYPYLKYFPHACKCHFYIVYCYYIYMLS